MKWRIYHPSAHVLGHGSQLLHDLLAANPKPD
jgi:hypothetical protein